MSNNRTWLYQFSLLVTITVILAGIAYYLQFYHFPPPNNDPHRTKVHLIRMLRMLAIYVIPSLIFVYHHGETVSDLGLKYPSRSAILSIVGGILIYCIAAYIFVKHKIFFGGWKFKPLDATIINLALIGIMASITDYWTRGFILLQLRNKYNEIIGIAGQNIVWFVLHLYEIDLLIPYIGIFGGILLTLFLGITGDVIALHTESIYGLMLGHVVLNIAIVMGAKGLL